MFVVAKNCLPPITNKAIFFSFLSVLRNQQVIKGRYLFINIRVLCNYRTYMKESGKQHIYLCSHNAVIGWTGFPFNNSKFLIAYLCFGHSYLNIYCSTQVLATFVIKASSTPGQGMSPCTGHQNQTEKAWQCKLSLNYDTYYFLLVVKTKRSKEQFYLCRALRT